MSLYAITSTYALLIDAIENDEIPEEALADTLEAVESEWTERAEAVLSAIKNMRAEAQSIRAEEKALAERRKRKERKIERLEAYITESIRSVGKTGYESAKHEVRFTTSSAVVVDDMDALIRYSESDPNVISVKTEIVSNKDYIKNLLKSTNVDGVHLDIRSNIQIK